MLTWRPARWALLNAPQVSESSMCVWGGEREGRGEGEGGRGGREREIAAVEGGRKGSCCGPIQGIDQGWLSIDSDKGWPRQPPAVLILLTLGLWQEQGIGATLQRQDASALEAGDVSPHS